MNQKSSPLNQPNSVSLVLTPDNDELLALLRPCPDNWLEIFPVDKKVGNVKNKSAELILPLNG